PIGSTLMAGGVARSSLMDRGTAGASGRSPPCGRGSCWCAGASAGLLGGRVAPGAGAGGAHGAHPEGIGLAAVEVLHLVHVVALVDQWRPVRIDQRIAAVHLQLVEH